MSIYQNEKIIDSATSVTLNSGYLLPSEYYKSGFDYKLVQRVKNICIYSQILNGEIIAYEVFKINHQKEGEMFGKMVQAKELAPGTSEWGTNAFTCRRLEKAKIRFNELLERQK